MGGAPWERSRATSRRPASARRSGAALETIRAITSGDGGLLFWFGTLVGGGTAILLSTLRLQSRPRLSLVLLILGGFAAALATAWTLVLPLLALLLILLRVTAPPKPK